MEGYRFRLEMARLDLKYAIGWYKYLINLDYNNVDKELEYLKRLSLSSYKVMNTIRKIIDNVRPGEAIDISSVIMENHYNEYF